MSLPQLTKKMERFMNPKSYLLLALLFRASASATPPQELSIDVYAGLSINGAVGTPYSIEYSRDLAETGEWRCLAFVQLPVTQFWVDQTAPATEKRFYRMQPAVHTNLVFIPPGTFRMGSAPNELDRNPADPLIDSEGPQTEVTISHGFFMGKYEVTQGDYLAIMNNNPSHFKGDVNRPVEQVTWFNATNYCNKLTKQERAAGRISTNSVYRLPTEAEWEYACRALTSTRFSYGDDPAYAEAGDYVWSADNSNLSTQPVGQKLPNPWGLYDMHGNVAEWCLDRYGPHPGGIAVDPQGPATGSSRVAKGGLWFRPADFSRSAFRRDIDPTAVLDGSGFRVVLVRGEP